MLAVIRYSTHEHRWWRGGDAGWCKEALQGGPGRSSAEVGGDSD